MADFIGPKEKLTAAQALARRKKIAAAAAETRQADLAKAKAAAPVPKAEIRAAKAAAQAANKAKIIKAVTGAAKFATRKSVIATAALMGGQAIGSYINKTASKGKPAGTSATTGRGGGAQGFIKDKPKAQSFSTASKPPVSKSTASKSPVSKTKSETKISSGQYIVKSGDTLSGIAKAAGVSLSDIRTVNPKFETNPKYKQGNMIWSGTKVKIPTKKK